MKALIVLTAFWSGFITLSIEVMGFRVLAPHFGYSTYVFGSLIGLILSSMAVGYWLGGSLSRRQIEPKYFFGILLGAGIYLLTTGMTYNSILEGLESYGAIAGTLFSVLVLWAFPMAILAGVSPYLVGLLSSNAHPGHSSGKISAIGTLGSLAGTFLTSFFILPVAGTYYTFIGNACGIIILSIIWLVIRNRKYLIVALLVPLISFWGSRMQLENNIVHAEESAYSRLEVVDYGDFLGLRTSQRTNTAYSLIMKDGSLPRSFLYDLFAVPAAVNNSRRGLLLGLGAGTLPRIHEMLNPGLVLKGIEIDPKVVEIGEKYFKLKELKNIESITIADARPFLQENREKYDLIEMDIFLETEIPFYLASKEYFELTKKNLTSDGILMMNIYDPSGDQRIEKPIVNTIASVYPETYVVPAGPGSFFVVAGNKEIAKADPLYFEDHRLATLTEYFNEHRVKVIYSLEEKVFTDDRAPIETLYRKTSLE